MLRSFSFHTIAVAKSLYFFLHLPIWRHCYPVRWCVVGESLAKDGDEQLGGVGLHGAVLKPPEIRILKIVASLSRIKELIKSERFEFSRIRGGENEVR